MDIGDCGEIVFEGRVGVGIISFDRPGKLGNMLKSLEAQTCLESTDFHLFQDGAVCRFTGHSMAHSARIAESVQVFRDANLPNKYEHVRSKNVGIGINQFEAFELLAENYDRFTVVEDDVVLSPHWFRLSRLLFEWFKDDFKVFSFGPGFRRMCKKEEIEDRLDEIIAGVTPHWWCESVYSDRWKKIQPVFMEYYDLIRNGAYRNRPHGKIRELYKKHGWTQTATSQDGGKDMSVFASGMKRACMIVNRGLSDGYPGIHTRRGWFQEQGFAKQKPYVFDSDALIEEFKVIYR